MCVANLESRRLELEVAAVRPGVAGQVACLRKLSSLSGMQLTVCTGRRCWRNGAGLLLAAAQLSAPSELVVVSTACSGFCPPGKVLVCEEASCPGPSMILAIESEEAATKAAAEAIATTLAHGRSDHSSSHECCGHSCGDSVATDATAPVIAERRTVPPRMKLPPSSFEERMNQQRAARREEDAAPAERPEAAEEATAVAEAAGAAGAAEAESIARTTLPRRPIGCLARGGRARGSRARRWHQQRSCRC